MKNERQHCNLDQFAKNLIRGKAKQLIDKAGFTKSDCEDIEQELYVKLLKAFKSFDPRKSHRNVFVTAVVERHIANILRDNRAEKRDHRRVCSLNTVLDDGENGQVELGDTVSEREDNARRGRAPRTQQAMTELRMDLAQAVDALPEDLRDLSKRLKHNSISQVARDLGIPRSTLRSRILKIRQRFERAGLEKYVRFSRQVARPPGS